MQNPVKYTLEEIALMREAVTYLTGSVGAEDRLRTYMLNGTTSQELQDAFQAEKRIRDSVYLSRQRSLEQEQKRRYAEQSTLTGLGISALQGSNY